MVATLLLCALLAQFHGTTHVARGAGKKFAEYSELAFGPLEKRYAADLPMRFTVVNRNALPDCFDVGLEVWRREPAESGLPACWYWSDAIEAGGIFQGSGKWNGHLISVMGHGCTVLYWNPSARPSRFLPRMSDSYRLEIYTRGALLGGGAVFYSTPFRFTREQSRRSR